MNKHVRAVYAYTLGMGNYRNLNSLYIHNLIDGALERLDSTMYEDQNLRIIADTTYDELYPWKHIQ